jgi:hypothetical protein
MLSVGKEDTAVPSEAITILEAPFPLVHLKVTDEQKVSDITKLLAWLVGSCAFTTTPSNSKTVDMKKFFFNLGLSKIRKINLSKS